MYSTYLHFGQIQTHSNFSPKKKKVLVECLLGHLDASSLSRNYACQTLRSSPKFVEIYLDMSKWSLVKKFILATGIKEPS